MHIGANRIKVIGYEYEDMKLSIFYLIKRQRMNLKLSVGPSTMYKLHLYKEGYL